MKGWLNPRLLPSVDSEVMVSAHLTESVLMEPVTSMRAARLRWNPFIFVVLCSLSAQDFTVDTSVKTDAVCPELVTRISPPLFRSGLLSDNERGLRLSVFLNSDSKSEIKGSAH